MKSYTLLLLLNNSLPPESAYTAPFDMRHGMMTMIE